MSENYILNKDQAKQIIAWKKESSFRKVAEKFNEKYDTNFSGQDNGISMVQEALKTLGRNPQECWSL